MNSYSYILFDLDGTLSDPKEGITKSVKYAFEKLKIPTPSLKELESFIGPPLQQTFAENYHFTEDKINEAIAFYRERFKDKGMFENHLYDGIPNLLESLKLAGNTLAVATSKPTIFSKEIIEYFQLTSYFDLVVGSNLDGTRSAKGEIIQFILNQYPTIPLNEFIMIGDRKHDIIGAKQVGIDSIGVTFGYGDLAEIEEANPTYIIHSVKDLKELLLEKVKS